ncbi:hypothetical protein ES703_84829 [subsurface metagenome]
MSFRISLVIVISVIVLSSAMAGDWPQFHGPRRDIRAKVPAPEKL